MRIYRTCRNAAAVLKRRYFVRFRFRHGEPRRHTPTAGKGGWVGYNVVVVPRSHYSGARGMICILLFPPSPPFVFVSSAKGMTSCAPASTTTTTTTVVKAINATPAAAAPLWNLCSVKTSNNSSPPPPRLPGRGHQRRFCTGFPPRPSTARGAWLWHSDYRRIICCRANFFLAPPPPLPPPPSFPCFIQGDCRRP